MQSTTASSSFIVLSEVPIETQDAMRALEYLGLGPDADPDGTDATPRVQAVVPADTTRSLLVEVIDDLGAADLQGAWEALVQRLRGERTPDTVQRSAKAVLAAVTDAFGRVGCEVSGTVTPGDPLASVRELLEHCHSQAVVVFSDPQLLEETFAQDWAHKVEDHLGATVLHLYPGSPVIGTS